MTLGLAGLWAGFVQPMLRRPKKVQLAALCYRHKAAGKQVLLVTSRDTGRWVIPKGWPIAGTNSTGTALQEAWEEAGVKTGDLDKDPIGAFTYDKRLNAGWSVPVQTVVYPVAVTKMCEVFPEARERDRKWVSPEQAANLVQEPELKKLLIAFDEDESRSHQ